MPRLAALLILVMFNVGCSRWSAYRVPVDRRVEVERSQPQMRDGKCVREVTTHTTTINDRAYKFRTGFDLYAGAFFMTVGWIFVGTGILLDPDQPNYKQKRSDLFTAGGVNMAVSLLPWSYFLWKRLRRPPRGIRAVEVVETSDKLEPAPNGCR